MSLPTARARLARIAHRVMIERGLVPDFEPPVGAQLSAIRGPAQDESARDLRALLWCSIDNDDSRDLDQLSVAAPDASGATKILVAIADVDAVVTKGSPIDRHAAANTTSVYTAAQIFPMLPERLSTDLTSLGEGEDRLAIVIEMSVDPTGVVGASDVYRALVRNQAKLAYDGVAAWLDGRAAAPTRIAAVPGLDAQLRLQDQVAMVMKANRHRHGALTFESSEARPVFDGDALSDLQTEQRNRAKDLIEDFMVAANGVTARFLESKHFPSVRRVLRSPERWERIVLLAKDLHETLPARPDGAALEAFLQKRRAADPSRFAELSLSVIKLLGRGEYALELPGLTPSGHFGLAVRDYTHSTAPNRRFPDVITQRLIKAALAGAVVPYSNEELDALARHCTAQEDAATKVERQVQKSAAALLLEGRIGERFDGIVTGNNEKGTWVRIVHPAAEGKLVRGAEKLDVGDRARVSLLSVDVERGFIDFAKVAS